jgi:hypothetical protein
MDQIECWSRWNEGRTGDDLNAGAVGMKAGRAMIELAQMRQLEQHRHVIPCRGHAAF